jgi:hypothetical protein
VITSVSLSPNGSQILTGSRDCCRHHLARRGDGATNTIRQPRKTRKDTKERALC